MPRRTNTKERIFNEAVRLFSRGSYASISLKVIADAAGITEGGIYRHYEKKEDILNEIFSVFERKLSIYLMTKEEIDHYLKTDSPREILERHVMKDFSEKDQLFMVQALRIVYQEQLSNPIAKGIYINQIYEGIVERVQYKLDKLIECGSILEIDTKTLSHLWGQSIFTNIFIWVSVVFDESDVLNKIAKDQKEVEDHLIEIILQESSN